MGLKVEWKNVREYGSEIVFVLQQTDQQSFVWFIRGYTNIKGKPSSAVAC